jgi:hypothetical protein
VGKQPVEPDTARAAAAAVASSAAEAVEGKASKPPLPKGEVTAVVIIIEMCLFLCFPFGTQS